MGLKFKLKYFLNCSEKIQLETKMRNKSSKFYKFKGQLNRDSNPLETFKYIAMNASRKNWMKYNISFKLWH